MKKKGIFSILLSVVIAFAALPMFVAAAGSPITFNDVSSGYWAEASIYTAVEQGIVDGYSDGSFKPDKSVSRAEFVKMVISALKQPVAESGTNWYTPYLNQAVYAGFLLWSDFDYGNWDSPITRDEMARIAVRTGVASYAKDGTTSLSKFMYEAVKQGIIQGGSGGELMEKGTTTRAQAVTVIERILTLRNGGALEVDQQAVAKADFAANSNNLSKFGMKLTKDFPLTLEKDGLRYTINRLVMYKADDPEAQRLFDQNRLFDGNGIKNPGYFVWVNFTIENVSDRTYQHDGADLSFKWDLTFGDGGDVLPLVRNYDLDYNNPNYNYVWKLKPGEKLTSNEAYYTKNTNFDYIALYLIPNPPYGATYVKFAARSNQ